MAFGGSGWAGGLREALGLVFAVDISTFPAASRVSIR
jgi:hypothetical protein